jgi:hypothetical protein
MKTRRMRIYSKSARRGYRRNLRCVRYQANQMLKGL